MWSAEMSVVDYGTGAIGAGSASLLSNQRSSEGLQARWLWYYTPTRQLRMAFTTVVNADGLTLQAGNVALALGPGDSGFIWQNVDQVDWTDGQTLTVRLVRGESEASPVNNLPTGLPSITGTAQVGKTLTASVTGIADADGIASTTFAYQWVSNDGTSETDIEDATTSTYSPSDSDVGKTIKVRVSFTDDARNAETLTSLATTTVAATVPREPLSLTVTRGAQIQELDASWQAPASNGGSAITGYKVQWKEADDSWDSAADVSEETVTATTHTIAGLSGGVEYAVRVIATNDVGDGPASAEATGTPAGGTSQQNVVADATALTISSVAITSDTGDEDSTWDDDGIYGIGDRIKVTVTFSEDVTVTGAPLLELDKGSLRLHNRRGRFGHRRHCHRW